MNKEKTLKKGKNKQALLFGFAAGIIASIFLCELFQALAAYFAGASEISMGFAMTGFYVSFNLSQLHCLVLKIAVYISPLIFIVILFELGMLMLKSTFIGSVRFSLIIFEMMLIGYMIVKVFYGAVSFLLRLGNNDLAEMITELNISFEGGIAVIFLIVLLLAIYLNFSTKRIVNYINI